MLLQNIPHTIVFLDDILVTGRNDEELRANLVEVLTPKKTSKSWS